MEHETAWIWLWENIERMLPLGSKKNAVLARSVVFEPVRTPLRVGRPRAAPESLQLQRFWNWRFRIHEVKYGQVVNKDRARRDE